MDIMKSMRGLLATFAAVAALGMLPHPAVAQPTEPAPPAPPPYAVPASNEVPSYAHPAETIRGRITLVRGSYIEVQDDRGYIDRVQLHQGTVINPTGLTLASGMKVTITGRPSGSVFDADVIDTPYRSYGYGPYYYPYPPAYYPYPYWGPNLYFGFHFGPHYWR